MSALVTVWIISSFITDYYHGADLSLNDIANRVAYVAGLSAVIAAVWFTYFFPARQEVPSREVLAVLIFSGVLLLLSPTDYIAGTVYLDEGMLHFHAGVLSWLYVLGAFSGIGLIIRNLIRSTKNVDVRRRQQVRLVTAAFCATAVLALSLNVIIPLFGLGWSTTRLGPLSTLVLVGVIAYAMIKHQLFDMRLAIVRTVTYALSLGTLTTVYFGLAFALSSLLLDSPQSIIQNPINIILALIVAFLFQPSRRIFDHLTSRIFYRDNYNKDEFFSRLNSELSSTTDLRALLHRVSEVISQTIKADQGFFFVYTNSEHYVSAGTQHHSRLPITDAHTLDKYVSEVGDYVIVADRLPLHDKIRRLLVSHKIAILLPIVRSDVTVGYLCLGERRSSHYTVRDYKVLEAVSDELGIAIQNALSVQEVKELNATLQQRIDAATKELRTSNAQLQRLDEAKDEFVSMASHQLRTPLTSVKGYIDMVLEGDAGEISDMQKHLLGEAFTSSERMVHLINDFLNVSRLQTGKFMIDRRQIDLATIVRQEVDGLRTTASQRQLTLKYDEPSSFPQLYLDEGKIRQVVMNFIDNAIYYSKENTTITVGLSADDTTVTLTVKDTGIGVPVDEQAQLFTKFYRASNARKQRPDGTGVGLYLAKKVIVAHDGSMVFSSTPEKGSTFGFTLPVKKMALAPVSDADDLDS